MRTGFYFFLIMILFTSSVFSVDVNKTVDIIEYSPETKVLVLQSGDYFYGELIAALIEGVLFQPVKSQYEDLRPPKLYDYSEILSIRTIDGQQINIQALQQNSKVSIKEYNLPELIKARKQKSVVHPFMIKVGYGFAKRFSQDFSMNNVLGEYEYSDNGIGSDKYLELGFYFSDHFGFGFKNHSINQQFNQKIDYAEIDTLDLPDVATYKYNFKYRSIFSPVFYYRNKFKRMYITGNCVIDPVKISIHDNNEIEQRNDGDAARALGIGTNLGMVYMMNRFVGLDASVGFMKYIMLNTDSKPPIIKEFYGGTFVSIRVGIGYYFSIESFY